MTRIVPRSVDAQSRETLEKSGIPPVLAHIYAGRGIRDTAALTTRLDALHPPCLLLHANKAAEILVDAIFSQKKCVIVADYDCDGATACAVGLRGLRLLGARVDFIVPNRFAFGYGLSPEIVELTLAEKSPDLIITVDSGIADVAGVARANAAGVEVLITDHHLPGAHLPDARVIVNPNQPGCSFPSKNIAGVGVMFYVLLSVRAALRAAQYFSEKNPAPALDGLLDLVALGTVADVVRLDQNNQILVAQGLQRIRSGRVQCGLSALFQVAGRETRTASVTDLGFFVGPRLNAAGRLADMSLGIQCLSTEDASSAREIAKTLDAMNKERRTIEAEMQTEALSLMTTAPKGCSISVFHENWHQGVIGIVASRLKDQFYRPTFVFAPGEAGAMKGSGRSIPGFHLRDAVDILAKKHPKMIEKFGGHAMAAGLTLAPGQFDAFAQAFEKLASQELGAYGQERVIDTDGPLEDYGLYLPELIDRHVWGQGFPPPLFDDLFTIVSQRILQEKHLKLVLEKGGKTYEAIWFRHATALPSPVHLAFRVNAQIFQGINRLQLLIEAAEL